MRRFWQRLYGQDFPRSVGIHQKKLPLIVFLENVKGLRGRNLAAVRSSLEELGYCVVLGSCYYDGAFSPIAIPNILLDVKFPEQGAIPNTAAKR